MATNVKVYTRFEPVTSTWQYVVADPETRDAVVIDSVLDFDPSSNKVSTQTADSLLQLISDNGLNILRILETHVHADHLTAAAYLQEQLIHQGKPRPDICIGARITQVQSNFASKYGIQQSELENVFDKLFEDGEEFTIGKIVVKVLHLPGHTPEHVGYQIGENVFAGDSIFNPDVGSARADFPGGSVTDLYRSAKLLLDLPEHYRIYIGHDYPPESRETAETGEKYQAYRTVKEQREENKHVRAGTTEEDFVKFRSERDAVLGEPRLLHQSLQFNIRAGRLPKACVGGQMRLLHLPIKASPDFMSIMARSE